MYWETVLRNVSVPNERLTRMNGLSFACAMCVVWRMAYGVWCMAQGCGSRGGCLATVWCVSAGYAGANSSLAKLTFLRTVLQYISSTGFGLLECTRNCLLQVATALAAVSAVSAADRRLLLSSSVWSLASVCCLFFGFCLLSLSLSLSLSLASVSVSVFDFCLLSLSLSLSFASVYR
jgi:hypothetical protein